MLTVDFDRLRVGRGTKFIDVGAGAGRHSYEALRRGANVTSYDLDEVELKGVEDMFGAMELEGEVPPGGSAKIEVGDILDIPHPDGSFDVVLASEILEHVPEDVQAISELVRILAPGGTLAVTVPAWFPEWVCWQLSDEYHANEGGHIRIYKESELRAKLEDAGLEFQYKHHAHALHSPFWWLKCAVGVEKEQNPAVKAYHQLLVWDMMKAPKLTRWSEKELDPLIGKSVALYFRKPF